MTPGDDSLVAVRREADDYPDSPPLDPPNPVYEAVSQALAALGLDREHAGTAAWNPLGAFVESGQHVVIKPNFVSSRNFHQRYEREDFLCCCTHPSLIRPLIDLAWKAVGARGTVSIAEAPLEGGDLGTTLRALRVVEMVESLQRRDGVNLELVDLRDFRIVPRMALDDLRIAARSLNVGWLQREPLPGDPRGYTTVDLGGGSSFAAWDGRCERLRFHHSNPDFPARHHRNGRHEYSIANTVLAADLIISVPKLKTHKKSGVTISLKNMIGTTNEKYWLPHFSSGAPPLGDEYPFAPPLTARAATFLSRVRMPRGHAAVLRFPPTGRREDPYVYDGNWSGNDTLWRTVLDLNRVVRYADKSGVLRDRPQRAVLSIVDGIIAGQGNGPLAPRPKRCGVVIAATDAWACDHVATRMMGIDPDRIGFLSAEARSVPYPVTHLTPDAVRIVPDDAARLRFDFALPLGWRDTAAASR
jgi:uncharacterized protein (DUF362 family)